MSKLAVLVTTMNQTDISIYHQMNLQTDAVIANQADFEGFEEIEENGSRIRFVTKPQKGLSKNRNMAIDNCFSDCEYVLFADDDLVFCDGYEEIILETFKKIPQADAVKFNLNCISKRKLSMKPITSFHEASRLEVTSFGICALVIKSAALKKSKLRFNEFFGSGTSNYCGEDSIFLQDLFKKRIKLYLSPDYIADIDQDVSSWYDGDVEHFTNVCGMLIDEIYPYISVPLAFRSAYKSRKRNKQFSYFEVLRWYLKGVYINKKEHITGKRKQS